jgi:PAS domain S-box-containing protein
MVLRLRKGEGIAGYIWQTEKNILVTNYGEWEKRLSRFANEAVGSVMGVPIVANNNVVGAIELMRSKTSNAFSHDEMEILLQFSQWASVALDNMNLYSNLRAERDFAKQITDTIHQGVAVDSVDGAFTYVNPTLLSWLGYNTQEMIGKSINKIYAPEDRDEAEKRRQQMLLTNEPLIWERRLLRKDGSYLYGLVSSMPRKANGKLEGVFSVVTDLTEIKQTEEALRRARNEAEDVSRMKSQFLAMIGHELRTPLNGIMGFTEILLGTELSEDQLDYARTVYSSSQALLEVIESILDFSRVATNEIALENKPFSPSEIVVEVINQFKMRASQKSLELTSEIDDDVPHTVIGDPQRVRQALATFVSNGIKYTSQGSVHLHVQLIDIERRSNENKGGEAPGISRLRFSVIDTGIGISEETQNKIFQPFIQADGSFRRSFTGIGLGLSICKHLVEIMGGEIGIKSKEGVGSTFWCNIPFEAAYTDEDEEALRFMEYIR